MKGVTERLYRAYKQHNIQLFCKAGYTIQNVVHPKDPLDMEKKCSVIYEIKCEECGELYLGEMERSLIERTQEHDKSVLNKPMIEGVRVIVIPETYTEK